ncbi:hypothetical protein [Schleiferilactobacillus harbinensis]|jgi:hypothetical protein|uniref:hypothetical protein n=1 Tax=Schleiferilactobacillus harbinensis TaxID=304207 RepID=UPI00242D5F2C|nr:hypothetical protein [Schleiferilactobacillus harbinensis]MCI1688608.1 hypothetical protein [Schleiferilactobacillus harbinensis]MCI1783540.1 hypothetical protein [Schleiferilactobacillus harbinensis]MCI1849679.1 hypothetical protein [Schleiferilactobacillus harbinensis]
MKQMYFSVQWARFWHNRKNQAVAIAVLLISLIYCFYSVPGYQPNWPIDPVTTRATRDRRQADLDYARAHPFTPSMASAEYPEMIRNANAELAALKKRDYRAYATAARRQIVMIDQRIDVMGDQQRYFFPMSYYANDNPFALSDGHYGSQEISTRYRADAHYPGPVTAAVIEERTTLQTLQRTIAGGLTLAILLLAVFFANDLVTNDRRHRSVLQDIPLTPWAALNLKTALVWLATMGTVLGFSVILILATAFRYGFGNWGLPTTLYHLPPGKLTYFTTQPLCLYLLEWVGLAALLIWLFIRLTLLLSILFRNEYIALILAGGTIFSQTLYAASGIGAVKNWTTWALPTYFDIGKILNGYQKYLYQADVITLGRAVLLLGGALLGIEIITFIVTHQRHFSLVH